MLWEDETRLGLRSINRAGRGAVIMERLKNLLFGTPSLSLRLAGAVIRGRRNEKRQEGSFALAHHASRALSAVWARTRQQLLLALVPPFCGTGGHSPRFNLGK